MKPLGIIGMGKMGQAITEVLQSKGKDQFSTFSHFSADQVEALRDCEVVIEFTTPEASPHIIRQCLESGIPIVSGTTGWHTQHLDSMMKLCDEKKGRFFYSTNFSIGMNITFGINRKLAAIMNEYPDFFPAIKEIHHVHKKDAPSGTALTLIQDIISAHEGYNGYDLNPETDDKKKDKIPVIAIREGEVKGFHQITWNSGLEKISLSHEAFDRKIFAEGAVLAAEWLKDKKPGVYTMKDIIDVH